MRCAASSVLGVVAVCILLGSVAASLPRVNTDGIDSNIEHRVFRDYCKSQAAANLEKARSQAKSRHQELNSTNLARVAAENAFNKARDELQAHNRALREYRDKNGTKAGQLRRQEAHVQSIKTAFNKDYDKINWDAELSRLDALSSGAAALSDRTVKENVRMTIKTYRNAIDTVRARLSEINANIQGLNRERTNALDAFQSLDSKTAKFQSNFKAANETKAAAVAAHHKARKEYDRAHASLEAARRIYNTCVRQRIINAPTSAPTPAPTVAPTVANKTVKAVPTAPPKATPTPAPAKPQVGKDKPQDNNKK